MIAVRPAMAWPAEELQRRGLYLVDSSHQAATVAASEAQRIGLASPARCSSATEATPEAAPAQLQAGIALPASRVRRCSSATRKANLDVLAGAAEAVRAQGIELVTAADAHRRARRNRNVNPTPGAALNRVYRRRGSG